jgi:hypothetical protein
VRATEDLMRRAAAAAGVLADLWPDGRAAVRIDDVTSSHFVVSARNDGVTLRRTGEVMDGALWDVIDLGESEPFLVPDGARRTADGVVSVELPARRFRRRPRPRLWTAEEVEELCRRLNRIDRLVIGTKETFCRVCGFDDHVDERYLGGGPTYTTCPCCESESGLDDRAVEDVRRARRAWVDGGRRWRHPEERPADWDPAAALSALPGTWRDL